jgi:hypothetical protein
LKEVTRSDNKKKLAHPFERLVAGQDFLVGGAPLQAETFLLIVDCFLSK